MEETGTAATTDPIRTASPTERSSSVVVLFIGSILLGVSFTGWMLARRDAGGPQATVPVATVALVDAQTAGAAAAPPVAPRVATKAEAPNPSPSAGSAERGPPAEPVLAASPADPSSAAPVEGEAPAVAPPEAAPVVVATAPTKRIAKARSAGAPTERARRAPVRRRPRRVRRPAAPTPARRPAATATPRAEVAPVVPPAATEPGTEPEQTAVAMAAQVENAAAGDGAGIGAEAAPEPPVETVMAESPPAPTEVAAAGAGGEPAEAAAHDGAEAAAPQPVATLEGYVSVSASRAARVYIDGQSTGRRTPLWMHPLPVGRHRIEVRDADGSVLDSREIDVPARQTVPVLFRIEGDGR